MLTVKTYLAPSSIHGIGLFATEQIPANSVVWQYNEHIDNIYSEEFFLNICRNAHPNTLQHLLNSSYRRAGRYFYVTDNARFINHSDIANIAFVDDYTEVTLREIMPNEEILENYLFSYDDSDFFFQELTNPDPLFYLNAILLKENPHAQRQDLS
ncbi:SET domain-containing protein [Thermodesulfobacteriota bacterium]